MATTKKSKPADKKAECACGVTTPRTASGLSSLMLGADRTLALSTEEIDMRREMNRLQISTMTADLRLHNAHADLAETQAARAHAELQDYLALRTKRASARK